ncbi:MAG: hypothetical protein HFI68_08445 [Lachnospiraceae bacterium]|nr:hypothetical protein [Lachnospiraceae bacterium]
MKSKETIGGTGRKLGIMVSEFQNPNLIRVLRQGGFQFVIADDEHGYFGFGELAAMAAVANGYGMPFIVRVPGVTREYITKILDMGADGILVPMVNTVMQAREAVEYAKYTPIGKRGISTTRAHTDYNPPPLWEYLKQANERVGLFVQAETKTAVENMEEIVALEGIDGVLIGPNDLAGDYGMPGKVNGEEIRQAVKKLAKESRKHNKASGIITGNKELLRYSLNQGLNLYSYGSELDLLLKGARNRTEDFDSICKETEDGIGGNCSKK